MDDTQNPETHITCGCPSKQQNQTSQPNKGEGDRGTVMHAFHGRTNLTKANHPTSASTPVPHRQAQPRESGRPGVVLLVETEMSGEQVIGASLDDQEEEVWWVVIVVPLVVSVVLFGSVVLYRCRAHRLRQDRIAQEREQELCEMKSARNMETGGGAPYLDDDHRGAAKTGLGTDYYMSAYKKLMQQA